jgi:putative membrane protein
MTEEREGPARALGWGRRLRDAGPEPDPRFTFANERTFLAWIRTSLAIIAAGLGVDAIATDLPSWGRRSLACALMVLGGGMAASSFGRWLRSEVAMRQSAPLPLNRLAPVVAFGLSLGAGLAIVLVLTRR